MYTDFELIIFSQVIDKELQLDEAIRACRLDTITTAQALNYHVRKELKRRSEEWENAVFPPPREGMTVAVPAAGDVLDDDEETSARSGTSPLTATNSGSTEQTSFTTTSVSKKKSRRSPRQACEARLDAKVEREELGRRYKAAFKQATLLMADPLHDEPVTSIVKRLNLKHSLVGTRKTLTRSTLYRAVSKGESRPSKSSKERTTGEDSRCPC
jgi:hypothetical protein